MTTKKPYREEVLSRINKAKEDGYQYGVWIGLYNYRTEYPFFFLLDIPEPEEQTDPIDVILKRYNWNRYTFGLCLPLDMSLEDVSERMYEEYCRITTKKIEALRLRIEHLDESLGKIHKAYLSNFD